MLRRGARGSERARMDAPPRAPEPRDHRLETLGVGQTIDPPQKMSLQHTPGWMIGKGGGEVRTQIGLKTMS